MHLTLFRMFLCFLSQQTQNNRESKTRAEVRTAVSRKKNTTKASSDPRTETAAKRTELKVLLNPPAPSKAQLCTHPGKRAKPGSNKLPSASFKESELSSTTVTDVCRVRNGKKTQQGKLS